MHYNPFFKSIIMKHYTLDPIPKQLVTLGQHCLQAIRCKLVYLRTIHPSHLSHPLPPNLLTHLIATNLHFYDPNHLLHSLAQVYLQNDHKSQQQVEKYVEEMLREPQEEIQESSESGDSFMDNDQERNEREIRRKKRRAANQRVRERDRYNQQLQQAFNKPNENKEKDAKKELSSEIKDFFKSIRSAKSQLNYFWQIIKTPSPLYIRTHQQGQHLVRVTLKMDNYFTGYCPKEFEGKGKSESIREAEKEAAMQLLAALFSSNDELLPSFMKLKRERNLK